MKIGRNFVYTFFIAFLSIILSSCKETEEVLDEEEVPTEITWEKTHELDDFIANYTGLITDTVILEVTAASTDASKNITNELYVQDGGKGISLKVQNNNISSMIAKGTEFFLLVTGLNFDAQSKTILSAEGEALTIELLEKQTNFIDDDQTVFFEVVTDLSKLNEEMHKTRVKVYGLQFNEASVGKTLSETSDKILADDDGNTITLLVAATANFANQEVPYQSGNVEGILLYDNGIYKLIAR